MENNITEIVFILDKSGSMSGLESDTIGGFNSMLRKQKRLAGDAYVSTVLFSNDSEVIHDRVNIKRVKPITDKEYFVGGCTALLDAIGYAIRHIGNIHKYARKEDVPRKTLFIITTDGYENASRKFDYKTIKSLIENQKKKYGWEFIFMGANIDAIEAAKSIGISEDRAVEYCNDPEGTRLNYESLGDVVGNMRMCCSIPTSWKKKIEKDRAARGK